MKFTCTYVQSKKLLQQYHYYVKTRISKWMWLGLAMIIGSVLIFLKTREGIDLLFLVLGVAMGAKEVITPFRKAAKEYDALLGKFGAEIPETTVTVDADQAVLTFDGEETVLPLDDVLGLYFCKDSIVLHGFDKDLILAHEGLENKEEIKAFLHKYCTNAPIYKR